MHPIVRRLVRDAGYSFRSIASGCHGGRAGGGMAPSLRDEDWIYGNRDAQIFSSIVEGRAQGMPSWHKQLTAEQTWKLVAYIKSASHAERTAGATDRMRTRRRDSR
jgi:mono/diheme cytochrome c family protein